MTRLDYIEIEVNDGTVTLPWYSRETLLREIGSTEDTEEIRSAFEAAGDTGPVELTDEQRSANSSTYSTSGASATRPKGSRKASTTCAANSPRQPPPTVSSATFLVRR